ncbi:TetR/AcrR family transcriptional regulator [Alterisphingorhabdus coralli]|uniref:TetR/AcrR family transcriptional regulator n=1 Tax=Alterisphingorhabdus coralli TaxID=3071408 RepID=A0AA97F9R7_9SPHN|nr:TetR/AcrR family transcriptional regulator [Parasphingorhabdus sp. SCSIO 66989]WOE75657.1 TetR/AcrR family transcriptional regulator [Parasphingorhabdus sp. SCSIO 66989]
MAESTKTKEKPDRKVLKAARILAAAERLLREGDGELEMSQVASEAGVSVGLAYHYFGSKSGMLGAIIHAFYDRYNAVVNRYIDPDITWAVRERDRLSAAVEFLYTDPMAPIILGRMVHTSQVAAIEAARHEEMVEMAARNVASGIKRGDIGRHIDPAIAGATIVGGMHSAIIHAMGMTPRPEPAQLSHQIWGMITGALDLERR